MNDVRIRPFEPCDLAFLGTCFGHAEELRHAIGDGGLRPFLARMRSHADDGFGCRIIEAGMPAVRLGLIYCESRSWPGEGLILWIHLMLVLPEHQRRGIGSTALQALLREAKDRVGRFLVSVSLENPEGIDFWRRNGFDPVRRMRLDEDGGTQVMILSRT